MVIAGIVIVLATFIAIINTACVVIIGLINVLYWWTA